MKTNIKAGDIVRITRKESLFYNQTFTVSYVDNNGFIFINKTSGLPLIYTLQDVEPIYNDTNINTDNKNKFELGQIVNVVKATSRQKGKHGKIVHIKCTKEGMLYIVEFKHTYKRTYKAWEIQATDDHHHQNCRCK